MNWTSIAATRVFEVLCELWVRFDGRPKSGQVEVRLLCGALRQVERKARLVLATRGRRMPSQPLAEVASLTYIGY